MQDNVLAFYYRLSVEDGDLSDSGKKESNSISHQRKLLQDYYDSHSELHGYRVIEFFDDGYSGTNFDRPQFMEMMELVRTQNIHCIAVKDLSRFGREYLEVGAYLELILPLFGTRFISVNDAFDSNDYIGTTGGIELALRNLINGMYSRDISIKVRSAIQTRNRRGEYHNAGQAFYGYLLDPHDKHKLVVDPNVKHVVQSIFEMCISGMTVQSIAQHLNEKEIPCPAEYKRQKGQIYNKPILEDRPIWLGGSVRQILHDERYTGKMITNKRETLGIRTNKMRVRPRDEWIVVDGTHEAIVDEATFKAAEASLASRIRTVNYDTRGGSYKNLFVCGYCGRKLQKSKGKQIRLICMKARSQNKTDCAKLHENLELLQQHTLAVIKEQAYLLQDQIKRIQRIDSTKRGELKRAISEMQERIQRIRNSKAELYEDYHRKSITKEAFMVIQHENLLECERLEECVKDKIAELDAWERNYAALISAGKQADEIYRLPAFAPEVLEKMVDRVIVFDGGRIEVVMKCTDIFNQYLASTEEDCRTTA